MAIDRKCEVVLRHAGAVVGDADPSLTAAVREDVDAGRAGVNRVLNQLLDDACRTLDHFARGDAVDDSLRKLADGHGVARFWLRASLGVRSADCMGANPDVPG